MNKNPFFFTLKSFNLDISQVNVHLCFSSKSVETRSFVNKCQLYDNTHYVSEDQFVHRMMGSRN